DHGGFGGAARFEAWCAAGRWRGSASEAARAIARVSDVLARCGWLRGSIGSDSVYHDRGQAVVVLPATCGFEDAACDADRADNACGTELAIEVVSRRSVAAICEVFAASAQRPRALALQGAPASGLDTALLEIARAARVNGYVPIATGLDPRLAALAADRTQLLIMRSGATDGWTCLLHALLRSTRPHVVLFCGERAADDVEALGLEPCTAES